MKNTEKNYRKKILAIVSSLILLLIIIVIIMIPNVTGSKVKADKQDLSKQEAPKNDTGKKDTTTDKKDKKELHLMEYEDLIGNGVTTKDIIGEKSGERGTDKEDDVKSDTGAKKSSKDDSDKSNKSSGDSGDTGKNNTDQSIVSNEDGVTVIDESPSTMKEKGDQNEYDGEENQAPIKFFDVPPSGPDVNGDIPASGEHIGNWN